MQKAAKYIQFSKKIVVFVCTAVTVVALASLGLCWQRGDTDNIAKIVNTYIDFAKVVFVAYSGNSAVEKWLVNRAKYEAEEEAASSGNG